MQPHRTRFGMVFVLFIAVFALLAVFNFDGKAAYDFVVNGVKSWFTGY